MLGTRHLFPILFGTLLLSAACQKIDDSAFNKATSNEGSNENTTSSQNQGNGTETNPDSKTPVTLTDGTQWLQVDGHAVALADTVGNTINALLISLYEWKNIPTGKSTSPTAISDSARKYIEGTLRGWRIPTKEEAKSLYNIYKSTSPNISNALNTLNSSIKSFGGIPINAWEKNYTDGYKYICQDSIHSFNLKYTENGFRASSTGTGTGNTKYHLRLVKDSTITK